MRNKYVQRFRISEKKFRPLLKLFPLDLDAIQISQLSHLNRNTVNRYLAALRTRMAEFCELKFPLKREVEIDDSYFGAKGVKGKIIFRYGLGYWQYLRLNLSHRIQPLLQCFCLWSEAIDSKLT